MSDAELDPRYVVQRDALKVQVRSKVAGKKVA